MKTPYNHIKDTKNSVKKLASYLKKYLNKTNLRMETVHTKMLKLFIPQENTIKSQ